ncbi:hypothetical protein DWF00_08395 [Bosea caraganae]|uniref:Autotransporter domain-containing protein n=1 Tax=Bosea caraganae TaxID=2763117 RepID=A0A370LAM5_9HYPH|nr:hypothetical protein [Bosea caraganae]RDJ27020.1 hypothetical protein DWF00_08395 [Bosea caraganae]RDJ29037.1 hypothetical protein DWE98_00170 [Bosea caraganae]
MIRPASWSRLLRGTTALTSSASLLAFAAATPAAQTIAPNDGPFPYSFIQQGTDATIAGKAGAAAPDIIDLAFGGGYSGSSSDPKATVSIRTQGGQGAAGASSGQSTGNGGNGGSGGGATDITINFVGAPFLTQNTGAGSALSVIALGGSGAQGGASGNRGQGGAGGSGGAVGNIIVQVQPGIGTPIFSSMAAGQTAVSFLSQGGDGAAAEDTVLEEKATGSAGGGGASGGTIAVSMVAQVTSHGSGITATSQAGSGANGGEGGSTFDSGTGGGGGGGGSGGDVTLQLAGGTVTVAGAAGYGTGAAANADAFNNPGQTVSINTSLLTVGLLAQSIGMEGGAGGTGNGLTGSTAGAGGTGGIGGAVQLQLGGNDVTTDFATTGTTNVTTSGYAAVGAMALSTGGNGGNGAQAGSLFREHGGNGGASGAGGTAAISLISALSPNTPPSTTDPSQYQYSYNLLQTSGGDSDGVVALSIAGAGGYGGSVTGGSLGFSAFVGGNSGGASTGGSATINNGLVWLNEDDGYWSIQPGYVVSTTGNHSRGLVAASIGGGGGRAGDAWSANIGGLALSIGGSGGNGGTGGTVSIFNLGGVVQTMGTHSVGIDAASIGGGGGAGGMAIAVNVTNEVAGPFSAAAAVGGNAGTGATGGSVGVYNVGQVLTMGDDAHGIRAQSIGGGGGHGGSAVAAALQTSVSDQEFPSISVSTSLGGSGGTGGKGRDVTVLNAGMIGTMGIGSAGILAQSIGGGGGTGGNARALSNSVMSPTITISTSIGGSGGTGGDGGPVSAYNSGLLMTLGDLSPGVHGQSIGGGGGHGGAGRANSGSYQSSNGDLPTLTVTVAMGGHGGAAGEGGAVSLYNYAPQTLPNQPTALGSYAFNGSGGILTTGDGSDGLLAQSIGGGGGNGAASMGAGSNGNLNLRVSVGGYGGAGGNGGSVLVDNGTGAIVTRGAQAAGINAQSVGGGGGRGGNAAMGSGIDPTYALGGYVGTHLASALGMGQNNPVVQVTSDIWAWQAPFTGSYGDVPSLNSIGDGYAEANGAGGDAPDGGTSLTDYTVNLGVGWAGNGGAAGNGGTVQVLDAGSIQTTGPLSAGIFAQSVGGGGGVGGATGPSLARTNLSGSFFQGNLTLGGNGGGGGSGGEVDITHSGSIATLGDLSFGILAQSVGGGGGHGGATLTASAPTGGGFLLTLGASAGGQNWGDSQSGGTVNATVSGTGKISTSGDYAAGILAQSVGGGGGLATVMSAIYDPTTGKSTSSAGAPAGAASGTIPVAFAFNGDAPSGSTGGTVNVNLQDTATIKTSGLNASGIIAQSVGNGGGVIVTGGFRPTSNNLFSNPSGSGNNGGAVNVTTDPGTSITTTGSGAAGILAQSAGGGGIVQGLNGNNFGSNVVVTTATGSVGGQVTVSSFGTIATTGAYAHGIFAQSTGFGGIVGQDDGTGFAFSGASSACGACTSTALVAVNQGSVTVSGANAWGVVAIGSGADSATGNVAVGGYTDANGNQVGGQAQVVAKGSAAGAVFIAGASSTVPFTGTGVLVRQGGVIDGSQSTSQVAIGSWSNGPTSGQVNNLGGTVLGSVVLGDSSTLQNARQGRVEMGPVMQFGPNGRVSNDGILSVGYGTAISATTLTGKLSQSSTGRLLVDTDHAAGRADMLTVQGRAELAGMIEARPITLSKAPVTVLTASGGIDLDPATTGYRSHVFDLKPVSDGSSLHIQPSADFIGSGRLGATQLQVAAHLQEAWNNGESLGTGFAALAGIKDSGSYAHALNTLSGQTIGAIAAAHFAASQAFVSNMQSCPDLVDATLGLRERDCVWGRVIGNATVQDTLPGSLGYHASAVTAQIGGQREIRPDWFLGGSLAYESSRFSGSRGTSTVTGDSVLGGLVLKHQRGGWLFSGALDAGYGSYDSTRQIVLGDTMQSATGSPNAWHLGATARLSYRMAMGDWYVKPMAELRVAHMAAGAYTEGGWSPFRLAVAGETATMLTATGAVEVGTRIDLGSFGTLLPFASLGLSVNGDDGWAATARFAGVQGATAGFRATTPIPNALARVSVGANLATAGNLELKLQYNGDFGDRYSSHTGLARLAVRF